MNDDYDFATENEIPHAVSEVADDIDASITTTCCPICDDTLYDIEHAEHGRVWVDARGTVRSPDGYSVIGKLGAEHVNSTHGLYDTEGDGDVWVCGHCADVEHLERGSQVIGIRPNNDLYHGGKVSAFLHGRIVADHYRDDYDSPEGTMFEEGILGDEKMIGEWFDSDEIRHGPMDLVTVDLPRDDDVVRAFRRAVRNGETHNGHGVPYPVVLSRWGIYVPDYDGYVRDMEMQIDHFRERKSVEETLAKL